MSAKFPHVQSPISIGPHLLKHRVVMTPHGVAWPGGNLPFDRQRRYYVERARGGVALVQTGATSVNSLGYDPDGQPSSASDPRVVPLYARFAEEVHEFSAKVFVELAESGVHERGRRVDGRWGVVRGVSALPSMVQNESPVVLDRDMLTALRRDYVAAARNLLAAGVDGITVHAGHSYLLGQFMSPAYNDRSDEYGGSLRNNVRFITEIVEDVREAVGKDLAVGLRVSYDEFLGDAGITPQMSDEYMAILCEHGHFDFFDISAGGYHTGERYVPPQVLPWAPIAGYAKRARDIAAGRALIVMAHRVNTVARAEALLADGVADLIGIARGHIADPELVNKAFAGRAAETNLCVGSNECVYNLHMGMGIACTVNPAAGREGEWGIGTLGRAEARKRVVVVGAGPAGLKTAQVAAARGHEVRIMERTATAGGSLKLLGSLPLQGQWNALTDQLLAQLDLAGVPIDYEADVTADSLLGLEADAIVVATGSRWDTVGRTPAVPGRFGIPGAEGSSIVVPVDEAVRRHVETPGSLGENVLIMDETGAYLPLGLAEMLTAGDDLRRTAVTVVSRRHMIGEIAKETWELPLVMRRIGDRDVNFSPFTVIDRIVDTTVYLRDLWSTRASKISGVSAVVIAGLRYAERGLYDALRERHPNVHLVGDSLAPRRPADAVYDGERLGRQL